MNKPISKEELQASFVKGEISRRTFLRSALMMGMSLGMAQMLLAACAPAAAPAAETAPAAESAPAESLTPTAGGELTWAINQDPVNLVPYGAVSTSNHWGKEFMYDSLVEWDKDLIVQPALAESWETPDEKTWIFHLRQDAVFHNGDPVTAQDVKYSIELQKTPP